MTSEEASLPDTDQPRRMPNTKKIFIGGENSDDAEYLLDEKEYLAGWNVRFLTNENGKIGRLSSIEGNVIKNETINGSGTRTPFVLPAGINEAIGSIEDAPNRRLIWFNKNSNGNHGIYCYDSKVDLIYTILDYTKVALDFGKFVDAIDIINSILYWIDDGQPKRFNIDAGIITYHPTYLTDQRPYTTITKKDILLARPQPIFPIQGNFVSDSSGVFLDDNSYQAAYRFTYRDKEISEFSPLSNQVYVNPQAGFILFKIPFSQAIPDDVDVVELAVRFGDNNNYAIQKTWTRSADLSSFQAHNAGQINLSFDFYNNQVGVLVSNIDANRLFSNVPVEAGALSIVKSRLVLADCKTGYTAPNITSLSVGTTSVTTSPQQIVYKSGSAYKVGVVFYDEVGRAFPVVGGKVVNTVDRAEVPTTFTQFISWTLSNANAFNEIPSEAHSYSIVRTKSRNVASFVQFRTNDVKYVTKDTDGKYVFGTTIPGVAVVGLGLKAADLTRFGIGYTLNQGDIAKVYVGSTANTVRVIDTFSDYIITEVVYLGDDVTSVNTSVEIYSPAAVSEDETYYELGNKYLVSNPGTVNRSYSTTTGTLRGDVYLKQRSRSLVDTYYVEVMNFNDKIWNRWFQNTGRAFFESSIVSKRNGVLGVFSNVYTTTQNGLSTFEALNFFLLPFELATVEKLVNTSKVQIDSNVLLAIGQQEAATIYIGEVQIIDNAGAAFVSKASGFINNVNILKGSYGTTMPESVIEWQGAVVWFDDTKGAVVKYDSNGLFPISSYKKLKYWRDISQDVADIRRDPSDFNKANPNKSLKILGHVDPFHNEFLLVAPRKTVVPAGERLLDMELGSQTYNFTTVADCSLEVVVNDVTRDCSLQVVAYDAEPNVTPPPTPTPVPTATPSPTPTIYTYCMGYDASSCATSCANYSIECLI